MNEKELTRTYATLTRHPAGSFKELLVLAIPLIFSSFSAMMMIFVDRLILAKYSLAAMNAAVSSGLIAVVFTFAAVSIAAMAEVFVAQYFGAKKFKFVGQPVWQMIWFSLLTSIIFIPLALFGGRYLLSELNYENYGHPYFQWFLFFGSIYPLVASISSFYVGIGKVKFVMASTIAANFLNIFLDILFIFGVKGIIPEMGTKGASMATGLCQSLQFLFLFSIFLKSKYRKKFGTANFSFKPYLFLRCLKVGYPNAVSHMIEYAAWAFLVLMMTKMGEVYLTVFTIGQSFIILFAYGTDGLQKAVTIVSSYFIGGDNWKMIKKVLLSSIQVLFLMLVILSIPFLLFPREMIEIFFITDLSTQIKEELLDLSQITCLGIWIYFFFDGLTWILAGILTAGGDTFYIMAQNAVAAWAFAIIPIYFIIIKGQGSPGLSWMLMCVYALVNALCFFLRYKSSSWKSNTSIKHLDY